MSGSASPGGYVTDVPYPGRFHRETMPLWLHAAATSLGYAAPDITRAYGWCELGCGDGSNVLLAAATNPAGRFVGVDFNAEHIALARAAAARAGIDNVQFVQADFADFATDARWASMFDFVVLHGVWSWVPAAVRRSALDVIARTLKPHGLVYIGYMSHPGSSQLAAIQKLLLEYARQLQGDSAQRVRHALAYLKRLADAGTGYFAEHPGAARQVAAMQAEDPAYLAHEFLTEHWQPQHSADVIGELTAIGCDFIGSATTCENIDALSIPGQAQALIGGLPTRVLAETVRDLARNQSLRRDLYQLGAQALSSTDHLAALDALKLGALPGAPAGGELSFDTRIGPVPGPEPLFGPVLQALAEGPARFSTLRQLPVFAQRPGLLNQVVQMLLWGGCAHPLRCDGLPATQGDILAAVLQARSARRYRPQPRFGTVI